MALPEATRAAICSSTLRNLVLSFCSALILTACNRGVPDETSVESCWKKVILSSRVIFLCGLLEVRARPMNQSSKPMGTVPPWAHVGNRYLARGLLVQTMMEG